MTVTAHKVISAFILAAVAPVSAYAANGGYAVPPSPYGQVGNPYLTPAQTAPIQTALPAPAPAPASVRQTPPAPPTLAPVAAIQPRPAQVRIAIPRVAPVAQPAPPSAPVMAADDGYQVPATSKYAARINAARDAFRQTSRQAATSAAADAQPAAISTPRAPTPVSSADHVFVPGEHYTDASQEPRVYSLHRQWGLTPDKITVDHTATGALLTLTDVPGAGKTDTDSADKDPTDKDEDDGADAPAPAKTATP